VDETVVVEAPCNCPDCGGELEEAGVEEQALRPAVVDRKVWGGNRTWNGARHQERLMTVLRTARQQHREPITVLADLLRTPGVVAPLALPAPA
jgi:transposase